MKSEISNEDVALLLHELSFYMELEGEPFKSNAYSRAARSIESSPESLAQLYRREGSEGLLSITGVGRAIAGKIQEFFEAGKILTLERLRSKYPARLSELLRVEGLGPRRVKLLYEALGVSSLEELEKAADEGRIRRLPGLGSKAEERIIRSVKFLKAGKGRMPLFLASALADEVAALMGNVEGVEAVYVAGSLRRCKETVGDIDFLAVTSQPRRLLDAFTSVPQVVDIREKGEVRASVRHKAGIDLDLRVVERRSLGAALQYFTGSKEHNIALRQVALGRNLHLNEYGLFEGESVLAAGDEKSIYHALGLAFVPPEIRENRGELEAASRGGIPELVILEDLRGDLQSHSDWSDGSSSIKEMALAHKSLGLEYMVVTDHTKTLAMTGGLDEDGIKQQVEEISQVNEFLEDFRILTGVEVNILKDGKLDITDTVLKELEVVGASVHTNFNLSEDEMTKRLVTAIENPNVDIIFHPTGRIIQERPPYPLNIETILDTAKSTGTILEVNADPARLDLRDEHIRMAVQKGVKLCVNSDAHSKEQITNLKYGVMQARRGWASKANIVNSSSAQDFLKTLKNT